LETGALNALTIIVAAYALGSPRPIEIRRGESSSRSALVTIVGDVMLARGVSGREPLEGVEGVLQGGLVLGNLESALTNAPIARSGPYRFRAEPEAAAWLARAGFRAMSMANNHALDAGPTGYEDTRRALASSGIVALGAAELREGQASVALLAFNDVGDPEDGDLATDPRPRLDDHALAAIAEARARSDRVVVLVHWGKERAREPTARQRERAERMIAAGADLIAGAHPHVLQPLEILTAGGRSGLVAYSLGNFVFDAADDASARSAILRVRLGDHGPERIEALPVAIQRGSPRAIAEDDHESGRAIADLLRRDDARLVFRFTEGRGEAALERGVPRSRAPSDHLRVDLRGDGLSIDASLERGVVTLREGGRTVWSNESPSWRVLRMEAGDLDRDGRLELLLVVAKPAGGDRVATHPFLLGWRRGRYRITWGGSATHALIQDARIADLDGDGKDELVVLEGGRRIGDPGERASVLRWHGWGFEKTWSSIPGIYAGLDISEDARNIIVKCRFKEDKRAPYAERRR
jgi:poly-gamma-glutamate synthesis protein (capsule biosynthesis protein)